MNDWLAVESTDDGPYGVWRATLPDGSQVLVELDDGELTVDGGSGMDTWEWLSPNGVSHLVMRHGRCATCGRCHRPSDSGDA